MFERELALIKDPTVRSVATRIVEEIPPYFYQVPASSTGKYHPKYGLGKGGLYRHTQAAVAIAVQLFTITETLFGHSFNPTEQDCIIAALIVHDGWKLGKHPPERYTRHDHPDIASEVIQGIQWDTAAESGIAWSIATLVETHMGQWTTNAYSDFVLRQPETTKEAFVHLCDYIASRKSWEYEGPYNPEVEDARE